jgi:unsaturated rhamnogalacturonyl hydrolase
MLTHVSLLLLLLLTVLPAADQHRERWIAVADRLITMPPASFPFNWGEGVQQIGLMKVHERTRDRRYLQFMESWTSLHIGRSLPDLLNIGAKQHAAYCGHWSPATAILLLHRATGRQDYWKLADGVAGFIRTQAERSPDGALGHWQGSHQLWVDTLYMACPLLAGLGRPEDITDAARQILLYASHLQEPGTGLFYHMWDWQTQQRTSDAWGRGNGWVLMSLADTLEAMDPSHPLYRNLVEVTGKLMEGLRKTQDRAGMWHTILDDPASYPETSATSMFCYGIMKLHRLNVLPESDVRIAQQAWAAINERYVQEGLVTGVSAGTVPKDRSYYRSLPAGTQTWGTGAYLMAGSEIDRRR